MAISKIFALLRNIKIKAIANCFCTRHKAKSNSDVFMKGRRREVYFWKCLGNVDFLLFGLNTEIYCV